MLYAAFVHTQIDIGVMFRALNPLNVKLSPTSLGFSFLSLCFVCPRVVTHALIYPLFRLLFGTLYPAYASYKAVRTKNIKEYVSIFWSNRCTRFRATHIVNRCAWLVGHEMLLLLKGVIIRPLAFTAF